MDLDFIADVLDGAGAIAESRGLEPTSVLSMGLRGGALVMRYLSDHQKAGSRDPVASLDQILKSDEIVSRVRAAADAAEDRKFGSQ